MVLFPSYFIISLNLLNFYRLKERSWKNMCSLGCYVNIQSPYTERLPAVCLTSLSGSALIPTLVLALQPHEISIHLLS